LIDLVYGCRHTTEKGYYPKDFGAIHGEDLAYVFGMPLGNVSVSLNILTVNLDKYVGMLPRKNPAKFGIKSRLQKKVTRERGFPCSFGK
jgi:hypothetical protein